VKSLAAKQVAPVKKQYWYSLLLTSHMRNRLLLSKTVLVQPAADF